jgi:hypothetical protein
MGPWYGFRTRFEAESFVSDHPNGCVSPVALVNQRPLLVPEGRCVVCLVNHPQLLKAREQKHWPETEVLGRVVHRSCAHEAEFLIDFATKAHLDGNAYRWLSNHHCVPHDCLQLAVILGVADEAYLESSRVAERAETQAFLAAYRANQGPMSAEERAEARAAFGPGEVIVDVITGRRTQL